MLQTKLQLSYQILNDVKLSKVENLRGFPSVGRKSTEVNCSYFLFWSGGWEIIQSQEDSQGKEIPYDILCMQNLRRNGTNELIKQKLTHRTTE